MTLAPHRVDHSQGLESTGTPAPDLRESKIALLEESLRAVVKRGALIEGGMPRFDSLTDQDIHDLFMYIRAEARGPLWVEERPCRNALLRAFNQALPIIRRRSPK